MKYYTPRFLFRRHEVLKKIKSGNTFLEIGPGSLNLTADILKYYNHGTLVDFNPLIYDFYDSFEWSTKNKLHLIVGNFMNITLKSKYDCIIACEVMEHIKYDVLFLEKIYTLLSDHGCIIISVPAKKALWARDDEIVGHYRRYEKTEIMKMIMQLNFKNIEIVSYGFPFLNLLRWLRIILAGVQINKLTLSMKARSQYSGISPLNNIFKLTGFLFNKYTAYPFCLFSALFNNYDLSDGYLITANK